MKCFTLFMFRFIYASCKNVIRFIYTSCKNVISIKLQEKINIKKENPAKHNKVFCGGDKEDRTPDLLNAIQALSQLSYTPK